MSGAARRGRAGWAAVLIAGAFACPAAARERLVRQLGRDQGTPPQYVGKIAQDGAGHLWLGTAGGLFRYDGVELRRWAPELLTEPVTLIAIGDGDAFYAGVRDRGVYRITPGGAELVPGPG